METKFILRKWNDGDLDSLVKHANNFNIAKYLTDAFPHPYTKEDGEKYLAIISTDSPCKIFAIDIDGEAIGSIGIFPQSDIHAKSAEVGYWLSENYWGQGIMTNAVKEIINYGFTTFDIVRIFARPFATNKGSQHVLEKAGMQLEARLKKALFKNGEYIDELIFSIIK